MNARTTLQPSTRRLPHAVVIGGSVAGLAMAQVLVDHADRVTIVERDYLPTTPEFRRGAPQARHSHILLPEGQAILERRFPGLTAELLALGAIWVDPETEMVHTEDEAWLNDLPGLICSRPLLEDAMVRRITAHPRIRLMQGYQVTQLSVDPTGQRVTGLCLNRGRGTRNFYPKADLVIDTSGRGSRAPQWLAELGYTPPRQTIINGFAGYTSRIYRRPANFDGAWKMMRIRDIPPHMPRRGMIFPLEGERWLVTLVGISRDYPPHDEAGFLEFARSLVSQRLYEAIKSAEPLTDLYSFRGTQNRLNHYESLPRYLEGFLVSGDAVCGLSPIYARGMTSAAIGSQTLADCLASLPQPGDVTGLAQCFQQQLRRDIDEVWQTVTNSDLLWPATEVVEGAPSVKPTRHPQPRPAKVPLALSQVTVHK